MIYVMYYENFIDLDNNFNLVKEFLNTNTNIYSPYD